MVLNEFFAMIFDFLGYSDSFSDDLFAEELYAFVGLSILIISFILVILFYYIINRPSFSHWQHWLIILLINFVLAFLIGLTVPQNIFDGLGLNYEMTQYISFGFKTGIIATFFFILSTYCLKWWSGNAKGTPKLFFGKF